jgi:hypothetical protein
MLTIHELIINKILHNAEKIFHLAYLTNVLDDFNFPFMNHSCILKYHLVDSTKLYIYPPFLLPTLLGYMSYKKEQL